MTRTPIDPAIEPLAHELVARAPIVPPQLRSQLVAAMLKARLVVYDFDVGDAEYSLRLVLPTPRVCLRRRK